MLCRFLKIAFTVFLLMAVAADFGEQKNGYFVWGMLALLAFAASFGASRALLRQESDQKATIRCGTKLLTPLSIL